MRKIRFVIYALAIAAQVGGFPRLSRARQSKDLGAALLDRPLMDPEAPTSTAEAFFIALTSVRGAGGMIGVEGCDPGLPVMHRSTLKEIPLGVFLDSITREDPSYEWEFADGAVDLIPASGGPALLRTRISNIHLRNVVLNNAIHQIISLPEVRQAAADLGLTSGFVTLQGLGPLSGRKTFNLRCRNVTVREALNAAALAEGRGIWAYNERHCGEKHEYTVDVRAE